MDLLTAIVGEVVGKIFDCTIVPIGRQVGYLIHYRTNLETLRDQLKKLETAKESVKARVDEDERKGSRRVRNDVLNWQREADKLTGDAQAFLEGVDQASTKCLYGMCPNLISSHLLRRRLEKMVEKIKRHENEKEFTKFSENIPVEDEICAIPSQDYMAFESRISIVKEIMEDFKNPNINMIGVYGLPGVGKTTLAKEVYREAQKEELFDDLVIILNAKEKQGLENVQKIIAEKLGMDVNESQSMEVRARYLWNRVKDKKTLVILDDINEKIDLEAVGLVHVPTCKLLLTSRDYNVLFSDMRIQKNFQLELLREAETWRLFEKMAGEAVKDGRKREVATQVAKKCGGLPVLIVIVASTLRNSSLEEWRDALRRFKTFANKELEEKANLGLEWSYNQLETKELKPLFLLCGLIAGRYREIHFSYLLKYSMGLGLVENISTVEKARDALLTLTNKLKNCCLLHDGYDQGILIMHELVRDFAIQIASPIALSRAYGDELKEWPNEDFLKTCTAISLEHCKKLPEVLWVCPELKLFILESDSIDSSLQLPDNYFVGMSELKVLDVTGLQIPSLPSSFQSLANLQTLCLDQCVLGDIALVGMLKNLKILSLLYSKIKKLPKEISQLTRLQLLDLTCCSELVVIPPNIISSLTSLEDLRMGINSFKQWEQWKGEGVNASVMELKQLSQLTALDIQVPDANTLPANLFSDKLERYTILIGDCWQLLDSYRTSSNMLKLKFATCNQVDKGIKFLLNKCEHLSLDGVESASIISYLLDSEQGPNKQLKHLHVQNSDEVRYVMNSSITSWRSNSDTNAFPILESLSLENLVNLESVCRGQLIVEPLKKLNSLTLKNLPKFIGFSSKGSTRMHPEIISENEISRPTKLFMDGMADLMPNISSLILHGCDGLRSLFSCSMATCLVQLKHLEISECEIMEEILATNESGEKDANQNMFCQLKVLKLQHLPNLVTFCSAGYVEFSTLELLHLEDCTKLGTFITDSESEIIMIGKRKEGRDTKVNLQTDVQCFLFDEKVRFPSLGRLMIYDQPKLVTIWGNQLASRSFSRLKELEICRCESLINIFTPSMMGRLNALDTLNIKKCQSLKVVFEVGGKHSFECPNLDYVLMHSLESLMNIFPASVAKSLQQLRHLKVKNCKVLKEIVAKEDGIEMTPEFMFPKAKILEFYTLPKLGSFYPEPHVSKWPLLNFLEFVECENVEIFASEFSRFQEKLDESTSLSTPIKQPFFLIEKGSNSFSNLEILYLDRKTEIWYEVYGPLAAEWFSKLKTTNFSGANPNKSFSFFQKLQNLEELVLYRDPRTWNEIFVNLPPPPQGNGNGSGNISAVRSRSLPHVKNLWLNNMQELMHLGNDYNSELVFPNLETLNVYSCHSLENLASSAISFLNLTTLHVFGCEGVKYLTTYSVAKNLKKLKKLEVEHCPSIVEIISASNGDDVDDSDSDIALGCLQNLKLFNLPSLQGFCSENYIVRVPCLNTLDVQDCLNKFKISSDGLLLVEEKQVASDADFGFRIHSSE